MTKPDLLDQQALTTAREYMGDVAWPTIWLGVLITAAYLTTPLLVVTGDLPLGMAVPLMAILFAITVFVSLVSSSIQSPQLNRRIQWETNTTAP